MNGKRVIALALATSLILGPTPLASAGAANDVVIPIGTKIYCELTQRVESKKSEFSVGDTVRAKVWRDVVIDGQVVIPRNAPIDAHISLVKKAKAAGRKGQLEISADAVTLGNGKQIPLSGGYNKQGKGKKALSISLAALVAWPLIFIKGKKAVLEPGTVFDAYTDQEFTVEVAADSDRPTIDLTGFAAQPLSVEVLYDELEGQEKVQALPMTITACEEMPQGSFVIDKINGVEVDKPLPLRVAEFRASGECRTARASVTLKSLVKQFRKGINRFDVACGKGDARVSAEVVLDIQI